MKLNMNSNFDLNWNSSAQSVSKSQITKATDKGICQQITNHKSHGQRNLSANHKSQKLRDKGNSKNMENFMKLSKSRRERLFLGGEEKVFSEKATLGKVKFFFFSKKRENHA